MHSGCIFSDDDAAKLVKAVRARERPVHAVFASLTSPWNRAACSTSPPMHCGTSWRWI